MSLYASIYRANDDFFSVSFCFEKSNIFASLLVVFSLKKNQISKLQFGAYTIIIMNTAAHLCNTFFVSYIYSKYSLYISIC